MKIEYYLNMSFAQACSGNFDWESATEADVRARKKTMLNWRTELNWFKYFVSISRFVWSAHNEILIFNLCTKA